MLELSTKDREPPSLTERSGCSLSVLLIDASDDFAEFVNETSVLRPDVDFDVTHVHDLDAATVVLDRDGAERPDIVLLALDLPGHWGLDAALSALRVARGLPVIVLAGAGACGEVWKCTQFGVQAVVPREPHNPDMLVWAMDHAVDQHAVRASLERRIDELEASNNRFLSLVADNADAILVVDSIGIVRFVNPSAEALLGCTASYLLGKSFGVTLDGVTHAEIDLCTHPHRKQTTEIHVTRTLWDGRRAYIVTMRDITARKRSEKTLRLAKQSAEEANAMKSQFLANMSHELRTPLNGIIGFSEMMMMNIAGEISPSIYGTYVEDIHKSGQHLLSLINDLLDLAKAESGKQELAEQCFDIVALCEQECDLLAGQAAANGLALDVTPGAPSIWVTADERMIKQAILNLLSNALKFTPRGGNVALTVEHAEDGGVSLTVSDTGVGIPKDQIPRAFAGFVQIENGCRTGENAGSGLGLTLTKQFVEMHRGEISLESEVGVGTRVTIRLPRARTVGSAPAADNVVTMEPLRALGGR